MDTARTELVWDKELGVESYRFEGVVRPFARHFHTHYVFGLVEEGGRVMQCRGKVYHLSPGHVLLINPGDNHGCEQEGASLTYLSLGIPVRVMESWARSSDRNSLPVFSPNTVPDMDMALYLRLLHTAIAQGESVLRRKEVFGYLLDLALARYAYAPSDSVPACREEIEWACHYLETMYTEHVLLDDLCAGSGLSKSTLLRGFVRKKGITPHQYLANIRVDAAKKLLEKGVSPAEVAAQTGFSDQSHFTRIFTACIGIPPGLYKDMAGFGARQRDKEEK